MHSCTQLLSKGHFTWDFEELQTIDRACLLLLFQQFFNILIYEANLIPFLWSGGEEGDAFYFNFFRTLFSELSVLAKLLILGGRPPHSLCHGVCRVFSSCGTAFCPPSRLLSHSLLRRKGFLWIYILASVCVSLGQGYRWAILLSQLSSSRVRLGGCQTITVINS